MQNMLSFKKNCRICTPHISNVRVTLNRGTPCQVAVQFVHGHCVTSPAQRAWPGAFMADLQVSGWSPGRAESVEPECFAESDSRTGPAAQRSSWLPGAAAQAMDYLSPVI